jgi:hypothetical protein
VHSFSILAAIMASALQLSAQAVISTRAGLVNYFEGEVTVAGQPLQAQFGKFTAIPEGADLRTAKGRAEVLLTPGVFLRVGDDSAVRMLANALNDTRVELLAGSAIVDSEDPAPATSVTLIYQGWNIRQPGKGAYRIDCQPPRLHVREGQVEVEAAGGTPISVAAGMDLPFAAVLAPDPSTAEPHDALTEWSDGRAESISADNAIAANIQDPATMPDSGLLADSFTYFPMLGLPSLGPVWSGAGSFDPYRASPYGVAAPYQAGFYSIYLPGYMHRPMLLGLPSLGFTHSLYGRPPIGVTGPRLPGLGPGMHAPVGGAPAPHYPVLPPAGRPAGHPVGPAPARPPPARPVAPSHAPVHMGGHR